MSKESYITDYILNYDLDIERMIMDFKNYVIHIIENNSKGSFSYEDKEEIISDVFLSVWHNKKKIDNTKPLKNYIAGITKNLIRVKFKKMNKFGTEIFLENEEQVDLKDIDMIYERDEINQVIAEELNNMKKQEYQIFCKYYYLSKSVKEIAKEMNLSENNVKVKLHRVRKKLKTRLIKRGIVIKILPIVLVLFTVTGIVFAKEIVQFVKHLFINASDGVETAIKNGYTQEVDMEYVKDNNIEIKVDSVLMDDFNLNIIFNINLQETYNVSRIEFKNIVITDEDENIILAEFEDKNKLKQFCKDKGIENTLNNIGCGNYIGNTTIYDTQETNYKCSYTVKSDKFPKSKKLNISFDEITLLSTKKEIIKKLIGNWNINIELDKKMYDRKTLIYTLDYCNDSNLKMLSAEISETGMKIECNTIWGEPIYSNEDSDEEKEKKKREFYDRLPSINDLLIQNEYVLNENGKTFYPAQSSDGDGGYGQLLDGTLVYWQTFNLTTSDATDNLTIVLSKGGSWKKEERRRNNYKTIKKVVKIFGE